jgi:hypothetical protein
VKQPILVRRPVPCGLGFGVAVYFFMKYVVLPLSAVVRLTPFDPLAMIGHAFLVGLPIALVARRLGPLQSEGAFRNPSISQVSRSESHNARERC